LKEKGKKREKKKGGTTNSMQEGATQQISGSGVLAVRCALFRRQSGPEVPSKKRKREKGREDWGSPLKGEQGPSTSQNLR